MIFIGIADTDNHESGGTGRVAREIAAALSATHRVLGVSRHQFLVDERIPYTSNNSGNVIHLLDDDADVAALAAWVSDLLLTRALPGSDPGLCIAPNGVGEHPFGMAVQERLATQDEALAVAETLGAVLRPLGGTGDGIIGAMAGAILAAGGNDGRFVDVGSARELEGVLPVSALLAAGVSAISTRDGEPVTRGMVDTGDGRVRPALIGHRPVLLVEATGVDAWRVIELGKGKRKREERSSCKAAR